MSGNQRELVRNEAWLPPSDGLEDLEYSDRSDRRNLERVFNQPESIPRDDLDELICRFLVNLPSSELVPPRVFLNIKTAEYFYLDHICKMAPKTGKSFSHKFAKTVCERWRRLHEFLPRFDKLFKEAGEYTRKIPSFGAVILSKRYEKILFSK
jgi:Dcp2, box A domain